MLTCLNGEIKINRMASSALDYRGHNKTISNGKLCFITLILQLFSVIPSGATVTLCGGVKGRFVCDDQDPAVFHICIGNNQYSMLCPGTLHFSLRTQTCDWPESVNCVVETQMRHRKTPTPKPISTTSRAPSSTHDYSSKSMSSAHTSSYNKRTSNSQAPVSTPKDEKNLEKGYGRYRLKVIHNANKELDSLLPSDEKVIAEVKSLSEELKTIENYLEELESDRVGYLIEPYIASPFSRGRLSRWHRRNMLTTTPQAVFRKRTTHSLKPYTKPPVIATVSHYHGKTYRPHPRMESETTDNTKISKGKVKLSPYRPHAVIDISSRLSSARNRNPVSQASNSPNYNKKLQIDSNINQGQNDVQRKGMTVQSQKSKHWSTMSVEKRSSHTPRPHSSGSPFSPPTYISPQKSTYSPQNSSPFTRRWKQRLNKKSGAPNQFLSTETVPSNTQKEKIAAERQSTDSSTSSTFQYIAESPASEQTIMDRRTLGPRPYSAWSRKIDTSDSSYRPQTHVPWWSTTRKSSESTTLEPTRRKSTKANDSFTPRRFFQSTITREPRKIVQISSLPSKSKQSAFQTYRYSTVTSTPPSTWWWSSSTTGEEQKSTQSPATTSERRNRQKYKPRHTVAKPNYHTRTPSPNFAILPVDHRSSSYMSLPQDNARENRNNRPSRITAISADKKYSLHGNFVKNYNRWRGVEFDDDKFSLHKTYDNGKGQVNNRAVMDKKFALGKAHGSERTQVNALASGTDNQLSEFHMKENDSPDEKISTYRSPVENYKIKRGKCSDSWCKLPDCRCIGTDVPGGFDPKEIPQMVMLTFDDSINNQNIGHYRTIFNGTLKNPNGCPIKSTFFVSGDNSNYDMVKRIYKQGHEIASHTLSHRNPTTWWADAGYQNWEQEIVGMKDRLSEKSGVPAKKITGMRAPFLQVGGDAQYAMLKENQFRYDSSMVTGSLYLNNQPPVWPFTLDTPPDSNTCSLPPCPTRSYPGLWEVPLVRWYGSNRIACAMPDACTIDLGAKGSRKFLEENFQRHYTTNRAPLGIFIHASWFVRKDGNLEGLFQFLASLADKEDVWVVTVSQTLDWIQRPVRLSALHALSTWAC